VSPSEEPRGLGLSIPQLLAGALAAASAAVAASWLGVAGTVLGAIVASLVASVSTALYKHPLEKSSEALRENLPAIAVLPQSRLGTSHRSDGAGQPRATGSTRAVEDQAGPAVEVRPRPKPARRIRWGAVVASAAVMLVLGFAILTGLEGILGKSFAALMGNDGNNGPTISRFVNGNDSKDSDKDPDKPTSQPPSSSPTSEAPTTEAPTTEAPTTEAPTTDAPTTEPSEEAPTTDSPTAAAPTTDAPAGDPGDSDTPTTNLPANGVPTTGAGASDQEAGGPVTG
jgi:hypothetical protein